jgi:hypothetical protein
VVCSAAGVCCQLADGHSRVRHARSIHHAQLDSSTESCSRNGIGFALCTCVRLAGCCSSVGVHVQLGAAIVLAQQFNCWQERCHI